MKGSSETWQLFKFYLILYPSELSYVTFPLTFLPLVQAVKPALPHVLVSCQFGENLLTLHGQLKCLLSSPEAGKICFSQDFHSYFYYSNGSVHSVFIYGNVLLSSYDCRHLSIMVLPGT